MLKEAELYHSQGLLYEAIAKYNDATELIQNNKQLKNKQSLLEGISKKINVLKKDISKIELAPKKPEVSGNMQDLIKKMYAFSPDVDEDAKAISTSPQITTIDKVSAEYSSRAQLLVKYLNTFLKYLQHIL